MAIVTQLNAEAKRAFQTPEVMKRMAAEGTEIVLNSPQEFGAEVKAETQKWRELGKKTRIQF